MTTPTMTVDLDPLEFWQLRALYFERTVLACEFDQGAHDAIHERLTRLYARLAETYQLPATPTVIQFSNDDGAHRVLVSIAPLTAQAS